MKYRFDGLGIYRGVSTGPVENLIKRSLHKCCIFFGMAFSLSLSSYANQLIPLETLPNWFKDAAVRTTEVTQSSRLTIKALNVDAEVVGKASLNATGDSFWYYTIDIGTEAPVECYVFTVFDGPANSLYSVIEDSLKGIEGLYGKTITNTFNYANAVGVVNSAPFLSLDTLYNAGEGAALVSGVLKARSALSGDNLQICVHNELGYDESFDKVFVSFVEAFEQARSREEFFSITYKLSINGIPMGFGSEIMMEDQDGDVYSKVASAMLVPVDASNVSRTDSLSSEWSAPDGSLINLNKYTVENAALTMQFNLAWENDAWFVDGQMQSKETSFTLAHKETLVSSFGNYLEGAKLLQSDLESIEFHTWNEVNPGDVIKVISTKITGRSDANLQTTFGPLVFETLADENGVPISGTIKQGPMNIKLEVMSSSGVPVLP